jgi:HNH endonuclease
MGQRHSPLTVNCLSPSRPIQDPKIPTIQNRIAQVSSRVRSLLPSAFSGPFVRLCAESLSVVIPAADRRGLCRTEAKKRAATDVTDEQQAVATITSPPVPSSSVVVTLSSSSGVSPARPDTSLPARRNRRRKCNNAEPIVGQSPRDLLSDLPYLDKHQYVDKLVEQHLLDSSQMQSQQQDLPRPLSLTQASTSFMPALVLNADYQPLSFTPLSLWSWQDAIKAVFRGKVTVVDVYDNVKIRGVNVEVPLPSVIALNEYVSNHKAEPAFTKRNVFLRDEYKCQYCSGQFFSQNDLSIDHVHPRCKGGRLHWENAVVRQKRLGVWIAKQVEANDSTNAHFSFVLSNFIVWVKRPRAGTATAGRGASA